MSLLVILLSGSTSYEAVKSIDSYLLAITGIIILYDSPHSSLKLCNEFQGGGGVVVLQARLFWGGNRVWSHSYSLLVLHDQHACSRGHIIKLVCRCKL